MKTIFLSVAAVMLSLPMCLLAQEKVKISGAMRNVMMKGDLSRTISIDTVEPRLHLYGLGPYEEIQGEVIIVDGHAYFSKVISKTEMQVTESYAIKSPFFVHTHVAEWEEHTLPDSVTNIATLEAHLNDITKNHSHPFAFKLMGTMPEAVIHIVNKPKGKKVKSKKDAHKGLTQYPLEKVEATIIGFFSTEHQTIFTHHDSYTHMHLITKDLTKMGHLDEVQFDTKAVKLYLPNK